MKHKQGINVSKGRLVTEVPNIWDTKVFSENCTGQYTWLKLPTNNFHERKLYTIFRKSSTAQIRHLQAGHVITTFRQEILSSRKVPMPEKLDYNNQAFSKSNTAFEIVTHVPFLSEGRPILVVRHAHNRRKANLLRRGFLIIQSGMDTRMTSCLSQRAAERLYNITIWTGGVRLVYFGFLNSMVEWAFNHKCLQGDVFLHHPQDRDGGT
jgi:hypothetical protein